MSKLFSPTTRAQNQNICECIACVRASFGRCTAKLHEKLKALQNARNVRRALWRQRGRARRQNRQTMIERLESIPNMTPDELRARIEEPSSESYESDDDNFQLLMYESEEDDIREFQ